MKKWLVCGLAVLVGAVAVGSMAACEVDDGRIEVTIGFWPDSSQTEDVAMYEEWERQFEEDYPQYNIVAQRYDYSAETIAAKATAGTLPTVFQTYFTEPQKLIERGWIADITDQLTELGWLDKMDPDMRSTLSDSEGRCYGVPRDGYGMGLFLNLKVLYDVGVIEKASDGTYILYDEDGNPLYPTTFDEIREVSETVVEVSEGNTFGLVILSTSGNGGWQFSNMAWNFGSGDLQIENDDGTWTANLNSEGAVEALTWIQEMAEDGLIYPDATLSYSDWYQKVGSDNVAMAFCGSDAITLPVTNYGMKLNDIAFVPMPTGDGESRYSLYGGTPYVFASNATDEEIMGALLFLKYIGRSPETDEIAVAALETGHQTALAKGMPIIPTIKAWINEDYLEIAEALEEQYMNVNYYYYEDFFNTIDGMKRNEEPNSCQDMYQLLDKAIQSVISDPSDSDPKALLDTANSQFQSNYLDKI